MSPVVAIGLLLVVSLSCAVGEDGAAYINFREVRPGDPESTSDSLELKCDFDTYHSDITNLQIMRLMTSELATLVIVTQSSVINSAGDSILQANGELHNDQESSFDATWVSASEGYSQSYLCVIKGTTAEGSRVEYHKEIQVEAAGRVPSIDTDTYDVSDAYNDHIYIASKEAADFDLEQMNELCEENGGYLAEINDEGEREFVWNFVSEIGSQTFAIGGNDVENEGEFVYYNSKTPVPDSLWIEGEPNNFKDNEDCVEVKRKGLNDFKCTRPASYVCELPQS